MIWQWMADGDGWLDDCVTPMAVLAVVGVILLVRQMLRHRHDVELMERYRRQDIELLASPELRKSLGQLK
jgi:hypothetical protein